MKLICIAALFLAPVAFGAGGLTARITLPDGATRMVQLEGVGCSSAMCSRTLLKAKTTRDVLAPTRLDAIASIKETTVDDALFVLKDGTRQRMSLVTDFRVLYVANPSGVSEKLDLSKVKSLEFLTPAK